jgi:MSHA pilin protein MshC
MNSQCRQTGFTMVELVTSIVIIGILAAALEPKFIGNNTFAERGYTDEVAAALRYAQAVAMANGCGVQVILGMKANRGTYKVVQRRNGPPACNGNWNRAVIRVDGGALSGTAPNGVTLAPATQITFDAQGHIANAVAVVLSSGAGGTSTLTIAANSGFVVVQ